MNAGAKELVVKAVAAMADAYGPQGWWPVVCERSSFVCRAGERRREGYHPGEYDFPRTRQGRFEICCGAVLTQNTAWGNVQKALDELRGLRWLSPEALLRAPEDELKAKIRPAGYFNQKSGYLRAMADWFVANDRGLCRSARSRELLEQARPELLCVRGIGPETADSILLYAYNLPTFVVDAYTRRVFGHLGLVDPKWRYERIRSFLATCLEKSDSRATVEIFQEAHAWIVEHAKRHHRGKPVPA